MSLFPRLSWFLTPAPIHTAFSAAHSHNCNAAQAAWTACFSLSAHNNNPQGGGFFPFVNIYKHSRFRDAGTEASGSVSRPDLDWNWKEGLVPSLVALLGFSASFFTFLRAGLLQAEIMNTLKQCQLTPRYSQGTAGRCFSPAMPPHCFLSLMVHPSWASTFLQLDHDASLMCINSFITLISPSLVNLKTSVAQFTLSVINNKCKCWGD